MQQARPSRTALRVAMRRAAHQLYDARPLVFDDPIAVAILGPHAVEIERTPGRDPANKPRPFSIALRAFLVARSRYAEDSSPMRSRAASTSTSCSARAGHLRHRNPYPRCASRGRSSATQQWKRNLLHSGGLPTPRISPTRPGLRAAVSSRATSCGGFSSAAPAFFSWLGVVLYSPSPPFVRPFALSRPSERQRSGIRLWPAALRPHPLEQLAHDSLAARVHLAGEAFQLFFTRADVAAELAAFRELEDLGSPEINTRYFAGRSDGLKLLGSASRLVSAWT